MTVTATPGQGYNFAGWSDGTSATFNPYTFVLVANTSLSGVFAEPVVITPQLLAKLAQGLVSGLTNLTAAEAAAIDAQGNHNGFVDLGDLLALLDKNPGLLSAPSG